MNLNVNENLVKKLYQKSDKKEFNINFMAALGNVYFVAMNRITCYFKETGLTKEKFDETEATNFIADLVKKLKIKNNAPVVLVDDSEIVISHSSAELSKWGHVAYTKPSDFKQLKKIFNLNNILIRPLNDTFTQAKIFTLGTPDIKIETTAPILDKTKSISSLLDIKEGCIEAMVKSTNYDDYYDDYKDCYFFRTWLFQYFDNVCFAKKVENQFLSFWW